MRSSADNASNDESDDVVYLLAELRSEASGTVLEIGSRARVLESDGDRVTVAVAHGSGEDIVSCSRALVARKPRALAGRHALRARSRPAF